MNPSISVTNYIMIQPPSHFFSVASDDNSNKFAYDYDEFGSIKDYLGDEKTLANSKQYTFWISTILPEIAELLPSERSDKNTAIKPQNVDVSAAFVNQFLYFPDRKLDFRQPFA